MRTAPFFCFFFFFNDTATTEIYTLSLHDALPISYVFGRGSGQDTIVENDPTADNLDTVQMRSEEHTSELQSPCNLVCRLLLEKKKAEGLIYFDVSSIEPITRYILSDHAPQLRNIA